jgi:hypothetical protein
MLQKFVMSVAIIFCFNVIPRLAAAQAAATPQSQAQEQTEQTPDTHPPALHTGWGTLVKDTAQDFAAFPKRKSTWVILGAGGAAALAVHPADNYVEDHIVGNESATNLFNSASGSAAQKS